jgi:hypothetical protein
MRSWVQLSLFDQFNSQCKESYSREGRERTILPLPPSLGKIRHRQKNAKPLGRCRTHPDSALALIPRRRKSICGARLDPTILCQSPSCSCKYTNLLTDVYYHCSYTLRVTLLCLNFLLSGNFLVWTARLPS